MMSFMQSQHLDNHTMQTLLLFCYFLWGFICFECRKKCSIIISIFLCYVIFCASLDMNGTQGRLQSIRNTLFSKTRAYNKACNNIYLSESFFLSNHFSHSSNELEFYIGCRKEQLASFLNTITLYNDLNPYNVELQIS